MKYRFCGFSNVDDVCVHCRPQPLSICASGLNYSLFLCCAFLYRAKGRLGPSTRLVQGCVLCAVGLGVISRREVLRDALELAT